MWPRPRAVRWEARALLEPRRLQVAVAVAAVVARPAVAPVAVKNGSVRVYIIDLTMEDPPKTRRELKKTAKEKKADVYSTRHARLRIQSQPKPKSK